MEFVEKIFYRKINPSDFRKMYCLDRPLTGGGQTYIEAAGISNNDISDFFAYANATVSTVDSNRMTYTAPMYVLGNNNLVQDIEFAPRKGRNYKISRQNGNNRHPAWATTNGFPQPKKDVNGNYIDDASFSGIIDNLSIFIIRTSNKKYYGGFFDSLNLPNDWPIGVGLEVMFQGERRGVLSLTQRNIKFENNSNCPFEIIGDVTNVQEVDIPEDINESTMDLVEIQKTDLNITLPQNPIFEEHAAPKMKKRNSSRQRNGRILDHERANKNKKILGEKGEEAVIKMEKEKLIALGRTDLANAIEWVSHTQGDGLGYDILSYECINGVFEEIYIEVKTTSGSINKPIEISANEVDCSDEKTNYYIYRLYEFMDKAPKIYYYKVKGSIRANFDLVPTNYLLYKK